MRQTFIKGFSNNHSIWLLPIGITSAFVIWSLWFIYRTSFLINGKRYFSLFDDAMISMRYAWNLVHGNGLVWNPGERVEGYTNLLMTLVMAVTNFIFDKPFAVLSIQILGLISMIVVLFLTLQISDRVLKSEVKVYKGLAYLLITIGVLGYYPLVFWSLMGMETGLLTMLLVLAVLFSLRFVDEQKIHQMVLLSTSLGLAFLTRNDSAIYALITFAYLFISLSRSGNLYMKKKAFLIGGLIFAAFIVGQLTFRFFYYGQLLPNTYLLKVSGFPLALRIPNGIGFLRPFFKETFLLFALAAMSLVSRFSLRRIFLMSIFVSAVLYQIWNGGDPWRIWRIIAPSMPLLIMLAVTAAVEIGASFSGFRIHGKNLQIKMLPPKKLSYGRSILIFAIILFAIFNVNRPFKNEIAGTAKPFQIAWNNINVQKALALSYLTTEDSTVGVFWAGSIPYYSERKAIDFLGKSDAHIAILSPDLSGNIGWNGMLSVPGHNKYDLTYSIKELKPTYIEGFEWGDQDLGEWVEVNYKKIVYNGEEFYFLAESEQVHWPKISGN